MLTGQDAGLSVDNAGEDGVVLGLSEVVDALRIAQETGLVGVRVVHLDGEGDQDIKGHQILGDAAHTRAAAVSLYVMPSVGLELLVRLGQCRIALTKSQNRQPMP